MKSLRTQGCGQVLDSTAIRRCAIGLLGVIFAIALNLVSLKTDATQSNQLVLSVLNEPKTFNYALSFEYPNVFGFIYEGLVSENGITGEIEPALANRWEVSSDKRKFIFTLREGLKWSDGQPLTADDVVFTYKNIYFNPEIPTDIRDSFRINNKSVLAAVKKLDTRRVEFTLTEPFAPFLRNTNVPILPAHALRQSVNAKDSEGQLQFLSTWGTDTNPEQVIVNGPYQIENYIPKQRVVFRRNPYYWRKDKQGNPQPYIERVNLEILASPEKQLSKFRSGELDILENLRPEDFYQLKSEQSQGNFTLHKGGTQLGTTFITFNLNKGRTLEGHYLVDPIKSRWFNTVAFRQAVAHAINRQTIINNVFLGLGELQNSPIPVQSQYYLSPTQGLKLYNYNLEQSKKLLLGAGFKYNNAGQLLDGYGNRVRFTLITNTGTLNKNREAIATQIKQDLSKIGIQVHVQFLSFNELIFKVTDSLNWDCLLLGFSGSIEPNNGINIWLPDGGLHLFNYQPQPGQSPIEGREVASWEAKLGRLYREGAKELDEQKRQAIYAETQRIAQEYLPMIYLVNPLSLAVRRNEIQNVKYSALSGALWNIYELKASD